MKRRQRVLAHDRLACELLAVAALAYAVYGHGDVGALEEIDRAFQANVLPLRAVKSDATEMQEAG